ncbi:MAG TPA: endolytic transglycosylase MltG [Parvularcula sp.]|nr:endolytic transglycosylase MltG [Parvularcula sp.]HBS31278.1 endolytic transglycosylase MltG [Parvularcula sp.]
MAAGMASGERGGAARSILILFLALALIAGAMLAWVWRAATGAGPLAESAIVLLKPGTSVAGIAAELKRAGVIRDERLFKAVVRAHDKAGALKAGEYEIPAGASVIDVIRILDAGKSILHRLTVPEGRTTKQILALIAAEETLEGEISLAPGEGELLPETYAFTRGQTRDGVIEDMMKAQDAVLDALWEGRASELPFSSKEEAIILASIVEKETGVADERPLIAAVFVNRLKKGMRLQSDPTIIYGLTGGDPLGRGLRQSELERATPYNTYVITGLPPTPIANPGRAAIEAVLNPADTDDLFFVADGSGGHAFAPTLEEHNQNVAKWRKVERQQQEG